jgi:DNA replication protein DnaC
MISQTLMDKLRQLRLPALREGLHEQASNPHYAELTFEERLLLLVDMECTRRLDNRTQRRLKMAAFLIRATIEDLDLSLERGLGRSLILELAHFHWGDKALNIIISGATGTGKSYMACALGSAACRLGYKVQYLHIARFLHSLNMARKDGSYLQLLQTLSKMDVLILDDWMRVPVPLIATQILLELFVDRYALDSTIISCQVPLSHPC